MYFDHIIGNVPFGQPPKEASNAGTTSRSNRRLGALIIEKALSYLKPGGTMGMICPAGYYSSTSFLHPISKIGIFKRTI